MYKSSNGRFLEVETLNRASIICNIHIPSFFSTIIHSFVNSFIDFICFLVIFFIGTASEQTASITCKLTQSLITYLLERKMWKKWNTEVALLLISIHCPVLYYLRWTHITHQVIFKFHLKLEPFGNVPWMWLVCYFCRWKPNNISGNLLLSKHLTNIVCTPYQISCQVFKNWGGGELDRILMFRGGSWERGLKFLQEK